MKRIWGFVLSGIAIVAGGALAISACAHDDSTIFVRSVLAPPLVTLGAGCIYTPDPTQPFLSTGLLDVAVHPGSYTATFLLANQMVPVGDPTVPQTETSIVTISSVVVRDTDINGNLLDTFTYDATTEILPSQGNTPGYSPMVDVQIISPLALSKLAGLAAGAADRVLTYEKFVGKTLGGQYVESNEYEFPVDVCDGCLVAFRQSDVNPQCSFPNCLGNPAMMNATVTVPCNFEDFAVDCQACLGSTVCNPPTKCSTADGGP
jgi:hypothetical protein